MSNLIQDGVRWSLDELSSAGNYVKKIAQDGARAACKMRNANKPFFDAVEAPWTNNILDDFCDSLGEPPPPPPPFVPAPGNPQGIVAYLVASGKKYGECSKTCSIFYSTNPGSIGYTPPFDVAGFPDCGINTGIKSPYSQFETHYYNNATGNIESVFTSSDQLNQWKLTSSGTWTGIDTPIGGTPTPPTAPYVYNPPTLPDGSPNTDPTGNKYSFTVPVVLAYGKFEVNLDADIKVNIDVGGVTLNFNFGDQEKPKKPGGKPPKDTEDDDDCPANPGGGSNPCEDTPDKDGRPILYAIITLDTFPTNARTQAVDGTASDLIYSGFYRWTLGDMESDRMPIDAAKMVVFPPQYATNIAIGSYTGFSHSVRIVRQEKLKVPD